MKKNTVIIIVICVICILLGSGITLFIMKGNMFKKDDHQLSTTTTVANKESSSIKEVELINTQKEENLASATFKANINNKEGEIKYKIESYLDNEGHYLYKETLNDFIITDDIILDNLNNININEIINTKSFKILIGKDNKEYLMLNISADGYGGNCLFILDEDLNVISPSDDTEENLLITHNYDIPSKFENNQNPLYKNMWNIEGEEETFIKVEDNKIYALIVLYARNDDGDLLSAEEAQEVGSYGDLEERIYTVNNGKLECIEVLNTYKIIETINQSN